MRHAAPHEWADLAAGRLSAKRAAALTEHAASCARCAAAQTKVTASRAAMADIAASSAPELGWEHIGARIYWSLSSDQQARRREPPVRWRRAWLAAPVVALAAAGLAVALWPRAGAKAAPLAASTEPVPIAVELLDAPTPLSALVTAGAGEVTVDGAALRDAFQRRLVAGSAVGTAAGEVTVQFGPDSWFALAARSGVVLRRFDSAEIVLEVNGAIDVEVTARAPGQRFAVVSGGRTVEVRGTGFTVARRGEVLDVTCRHGRVAVVDAAAQVDVSAGTTLQVLDGEPLLARQPRPLSGAELAALMPSPRRALPAWTAPEALLGASSVLDIAGSRRVRVDGVLVGEGTLMLRVMSGRHWIETEAPSGEWSAGRWVEAGGGTVTAVVAAAPRVSSSKGASARRDELDDKTPAGALSGCLRSLAKQGIEADTYVELELGVDAQGAINFVNVVATDLPATPAACVRDAVARTKFAAGRAATWRHRFEF